MIYMKNTLTTIGQRIAYARKQRHKNQSDLARDLGITPTAVQKWEDGRANPSSKRYEELAAALGVTAEFLVTGRGEMPRSPDYEPVDMGQDVIPILSWERVARMLPGEPPPLFEKGSEHMTRPSTISRAAFALRVRGISMSPEFSEGDVIFVEPHLEAKTGDYVIAKLPRATEATFKKLVIEDGRRVLIPLNPDWTPKSQELTGEGFICGVVVAKMVSYK